MPLMTDPLAHVQDVLSVVEFDIEKWNREKLKIEARLEVLRDFHGRLRDALDHERAKVATPSTTMEKK